MPKATQKTSITHTCQSGEIRVKSAAEINDLKNKLRVASPIGIRFSDLNPRESLLVDPVTCAPRTDLSPIPISSLINTADEQHGPFSPLATTFPDSTRPQLACQSKAMTDPGTTTKDFSDANSTNPPIVIAFTLQPTVETTWRTPLLPPRSVPWEKMKDNAAKIPLDADEERRAFHRLRFFITRAMIHLPGAMEILSPFGNHFRRDLNTRTRMMYIIKTVMLDLFHCVNILHNIDTDHNEAATVMVRKT